MPEMTYAASIEDIRAAARRIATYAHRTPVLTCSALDELAGRSLFFKCENFQKVGAFKFRGACNAVMKLPDDLAANGVVTHSSGNHAQAIALAARVRGIEAHIVMPRTASQVKKEAVRGYGGTIYDCEPNSESRHGEAERLQNKTGATMIPPYDHPDIIAGQGTAAMELHEEIDDLDAIIAPVGGGGVMSGTSIATRALRPESRIFGAEPKLADDAARSLATGKRQPEVNPPQTIADGLLTGLGDLTWPIIRDHVERIFTVSEEQIVHAMRTTMQRMKIMLEPSSAVPIAAVLSDEFKTMKDIDRVGIIISGGNVDLDNLPW